MRTVVIFCLLLGCAAGCDKTEKPDNSPVQTPNDQPIGAPKPPGGGKALRLTEGPGAGVQVGGAGPRHKLEVKK